MFEYRVESGPLKITVVAETAYDAAVEAVRWWGHRTQRGANGHRESLDAALLVRGREGTTPVRERFPTFNLLAEAEGEAPESAWDRLLDLVAANPN